MSSIRKNYIYNILYNFLMIIIPFITVPYISRVLGAKGVGIYSYTYSIVYYFMLMAMLGINNYGNRTIAKTKNNIYILSKNFFEIYLIQIIATSIIIFLYIVYIFLFNHEYYLISLIQILYLLSVLFDINWFFFGLEKFKITVTRSSILRLISLIMIFILVKSKNDLWRYTLIMSGSTLISQLILLPFLFKEVKMVKIKLSDLYKHLKPCLLLFIPVIAVSLYKVMDKIMLGLLSNVEEVGYYEQAEKIIGIPLSLITSLGTVMLPRISNLVSKNNENEIKKYIKKSINFMMFLAFPICFGLIAVSSNFIPLFLGNDFIKTSTILYYISATIVFISFANVIRTQYLIPKEKDKIYVISVIGGAIINLLINYMLINKYKSIGACVGTIAAEFFVMMYQIIAVRKELPIKAYIRDSIQYFIKSLIMFIIVLLITFLPFRPIYIIILQIIIGGIVYGLLNIKYIILITNFNNIKVFNKILSVMNK